MKTANHKALTAEQLRKVIGGDRNPASGDPGRRGNGGADEAFRPKWIKIG